MAGGHREPAKEQPGTVLPLNSGRDGGVRHVWIETGNKVLTDYRESRE